MEIKHLKTLLAIVRFGTFEKAALELNYSQSTITFQMKQLEEDLGLPLFEKVGRNLRLTDDAGVLLPQINRLISQYDALVTFSMPLAAITGTYRIAAAESLLLYKLQPLVQSFHQLLPKMNLQVEMVTNNTLEMLVQSGNADIGIYYQNHSNKSSLFRKRRWASYRTILVGRKSMLNVDDNAPARISGDIDSNYDKAYSDFLDASGQTMQTINVGSVTAAKKQILFGTGVGVLPEFMVREELASGTLVDLSSPITLPNVQVISLTRASQTSGRVTRAVEGMLAELAW